MYSDEKAVSSADFLAKAAAYFQCFGITPKRTRHYRPQTNGKAERFIQTAIGEWAYARRYENSAKRREELMPWTQQYNWHRPHSSLLHKPPITRSGLNVNNLLIHHS
jgi:transposase InsO family protein